VQEAPLLLRAAQHCSRTLPTHTHTTTTTTAAATTQDLHKQLEARISRFHGTQDTILYPSCFDANTGLFEALLTAEDAVISDELNHASIIDGIRLCKVRLAGGLGLAGSLGAEAGGCEAGAAACCGRVLGSAAGCTREAAALAAAHPRPPPTPPTALPRPPGPAAALQAP
jgi:hypothetical protein